MEKGFQLTTSMPLADHETGRLRFSLPALVAVGGQSFDTEFIGTSFEKFRRFLRTATDNRSMASHGSKMRPDLIGGGLFTFIHPPIP